MKVLLLITTRKTIFLNFEKHPQVSWVYFIIVIQTLNTDINRFNKWTISK